MSGIGPAGGPGEIAALTPAQQKLRTASHQLEGVFLAQLFRAMRETVPQDGQGGEAQAMFTSMLDDTLAAKAADGLERGLGEALYRQLSRRLGEDTEAR